MRRTLIVIGVLVAIAAAWASGASSERDVPREAAPAPATRHAVLTGKSGSDIRFRAVADRAPRDRWCVYITTSRDEAYAAEAHVTAEFDSTRECGAADRGTATAATACPTAITFAGVVPHTARPRLIARGGRKDTVSVRPLRGHGGRLATFYAVTVRPAEVPAELVEADGTHLAGIPAFDELC
jgi:hypothetical protein